MVLKQFRFRFVVAVLFDPSLNLLFRRVLGGEVSTGNYFWREDAEEQQEGQKGDSNQRWNQIEDATNEISDQFLPPVVDAGTRARRFRFRFTVATAGIDPTMIRMSAMKNGPMTGAFHSA